MELGQGGGTEGGVTPSALRLVLQQTEPEPEVPPSATTPGAVPGTVTPNSATPAGVAAAAAAAAAAANLSSLTDAQKNNAQPKRLHVSNIPFRFRDPDLRSMFGVSHLYFNFLVFQCTSLTTWQ